MCENPHGRGNLGVRLGGGVELHEDELFESCLDETMARGSYSRGGVGPMLETAYEFGAAIAFGIIGMATAIKKKHWLEACPLCLKASYGWVGIGKDAICIDCSNNGQRASRSTGHPYR